MGLSVSVYKFPLGDCTLNGISGRAADLCLVNVEGPSKPSPTQPAALLVRGNGRGLVKIVPAEWRDIGEWGPVAGWTMMGGNYASTSDSRFHEAVRKITGNESYGAVPIHDRIEA
jgi:hypothetical protein